MVATTEEIKTWYQTGELEIINNRGQSVPLTDHITDSIITAGSWGRIAKGGIVRIPAPSEWVEIRRTYQTMGIRDLREVPLNDIIADQSIIWAIRWDNSTMVANDTGTFVITGVDDKRITVKSVKTRCSKCKLPDEEDGRCLACEILDDPEDATDDELFLALVNLMDRDLPVSGYNHARAKGHDPLHYDLYVRLEKLEKKYR